MARIYKFPIAEKVYEKRLEALRQGQEEETEQHEEYNVWLTELIRQMKETEGRLF